MNNTSLYIVISVIGYLVFAGIFLRGVWWFLYGKSKLKPLEENDFEISEIVFDDVNKNVSEMHKHYKQQKSK